MIGKYLIVSELEGGGQSRVFRAVHPTLDKELVIKVSRQPLPGGADCRPLLLAEGKLLASFEHPNLARVYDLDFHEDAAFLVMEYVRGPTMQQLVTSGQRVPPRRAAEWMAKVARALAVVHRHGVLHQDIEPANMILAADEQPRLIDFGLARLRHAWDDRRGVPSGGTPAFMAPEQARGEEARIGPSSDLFSLGAVLYFLLTGKAPFRGETVEETLQQAARCDFDRKALSAAGVPRPLRDICLKAMAAQPTDRYSSAVALAGELEQRLRRPGLVFLGGLAGAAALVLVGALWLWLRPSASYRQFIDVTDLQVQVTRDGAYIELREALPLHTARDRLQIVGKIPPGQYGALFLVNTRGEVCRLELETSSADTFTRLVYPGGGGQVPFDRDSKGTELILLCAGPSPGAFAVVEALLRDIGDLPELPPGVLVWLTREEPRREAVRRVPMGPRAPDPVAEVEYHLDQLRQKLRGRFEVFRGVAFAHK
jgi:predicted Ser/Thr protein kinase